MTNCKIKIFDLELEISNSELDTETLITQSLGMVNYLIPEMQKLQGIEPGEEDGVGHIEEPPQTPCNIIDNVSSRMYQ